MKIKFDPLIIYIAVAILLAYILPHDWLSYAGNTYDVIVKWGVSIVFFLYGIKIPISDFVNTLKKWRVLLTTQMTTFLVFPIFIIGICYWLFEEWTHPLVIGFIFLSVLPSTVSSSVVMTSWANGNIAIAVFNAFITGIIGVVWTPMMIEYVLDVESLDINLMQVYSSLATEVLIPLLIGMLLQKWLRPTIVKYPDIIAHYDKIIIFLIIFKAFSVMFRDQLLNDMSGISIGFMLLGIVVIFTLMSLFLLFISRMLKLNYEDKMALYFGGVQKSFVHASVFSKILFKSSPLLGFILMPTMIYHLFQIILTSILAQYFKSRHFSD